MKIKENQGKSKKLIRTQLVSRFRIAPRISRRFTHPSIARSRRVDSERISQHLQTRRHHRAVTSQSWSVFVQSLTFIDFS